MKIIFSRKGFDSGIGGVASPIFPSDEIWSIPIPDATSRMHYRDIVREEQSMGTLVNDLTQGCITPNQHAHLDPDLDVRNLSRTAGWKPLFGQTGAAESHLRNMGVGPDDLFLFFGWFRSVKCVSGVYRYVAGEPDMHVLFGWLQIEQRISVTNQTLLPTWALDHPHCSRALPRNANDSLYVATDYLSLPDTSLALPGGGVFQHFHPMLRLTADGLSRSVWRLPEWLHPDNSHAGLSYHTSMKRWIHDNDSVLLSTVGRGQEFVFDCKDSPLAHGWLADIFRTATCHLYGRS
jgi:hypothetical protein